MAIPIAPPPPPPPPPTSDTITVTASIDLRGTAQFNKTKIVFNANDFARLTLSSIQFGNGNISDSVAVTGDGFRNFIDVHLTNGDTSFSAAGWTFTNWIPYTPLQNDQVSITGSDAGDTITGSSQADSIVGLGGADTLSGLDGRDYLIGGDGIDTLLGGAGDDAYRLQDVHQTSQSPLRFAYDTVIEDANGGIDSVEIYRAGIWGRYTLPENVENGVIFGPGTFTLSGNSLANVLTGNEDVNTLLGQNGADTLKGNGGDDVLLGGRGGDVMDGGNGTDRADYSSATAGVTVSLAIAGPQVTGQGSDTLIAMENLIGSRFDDRLTGDSLANLLMGEGGADLLVGNAGNDVLSGASGRDRLNGGSGLDSLSGGSGNDVLVGGADADTFIFAPNSGNDTIIDFTDTNGASDDVIDVNAYGFASVSDIGKQTSGNDLVLVFAPGDTLVLRDYLATHGVNAINNDIIIA